MRNGNRFPAWICWTISTLLLSVILAGSSEAQGPKLLRWKLKSGDAMDVILQQTVDAEQSIFGNELKSKADMQLDMRWLVRSVSPEEVAEIQQSVEHIRMKMEAPGTGSVEFDSSSAKDLSGMAKVLYDNVQPMIGLHILQRMNSRGEILDVRLSDEAQQKLKASGAAQQILAKEDIESMLAQSAAVLPVKPVRPGESWEGATTSKSPLGALAMKMKYTYRGTVQHAGRALDQIDVAIQMQIEEASNQGMSVAIKEQGSQGSMFFDEVAGRFVESEFSQNLTLQTKIGDAMQEQKLATKMHIQFLPVTPGQPRLTAGPSSLRAAPASARLETQVPAAR